MGLAELLELNFHVRGGKVANPFLQLFLVPQADERLPRSVWQLVRDRGRFHNPTADGDPVEWCQREIVESLSREQSLAREVAELARQDPNLAADLKVIPGLFDRATKFHPRRLPAGA